MEIHERISAILSHYGLSVNEFVERAGIKTKQAVYDLLHGKTRSISTAMENKILSCFPDINRAWLLTGEGEMLNVTEVVEVTEHGTPVYDLDVTCGGRSRPIVFADEHIIGHVNLPNVSPTAAIIRANGDSMEPHIHDGDWIAVREVKNMNVLYYGQVYVVITDELRLLKYLRRDEDEQHYVILRSENKNYDDIRLAKSEIRHLFIVENILSLHIKL